VEESFPLGMPRSLLGAFIPVLLSIYYIFVTDVSPKSKSIVAVLLMLSLITVFVAPAHWLWVLWLQVAVGIYIAFYLIWERR
jgi:hypothetical protein